MTPEQVVLWLSTLPNEVGLPQHDGKERKRKRTHAHTEQQAGFLSPPQSAMDADAEERQHKRARTESRDHDIDQTPRASRRLGLGGPQMDAPDTESSASQSVTDTSGRGSSRGGPGSKTSGRSSPRKRLRALALQDDGIVVQDFTTPSITMPVELKSFLHEFKVISSGAGVISSGRRQEIENMVESPAIADTSLFSAPLPFHYTSDGAEQKKRDSLGPTPSVDQVLCVLDWAQQCALRAAEEAMWNSAVHFPLLKMAVHGGGRVPAGGDTTTVGLTQCTTARIIQEYLPVKETSAKQIDFCLHSDADADAAAQIYAIRQSSLWPSINHTFFEGLLDRPIVLNCESKRLDLEGTIQATLQIGLWHAAQWKHLKTLAVQQQSSSQLPTFLPAVIISGHDWLFAATTQVQNKTILWKEYPFGHTRDAWGVYRIICGLQRLKAWALNDYWPWYRGHILGLTT